MDNRQLTPSIVGPVAEAARPAGLVAAVAPANQEFDDRAALSAWLAIFDIKSPATAASYRSQTRKFSMFLNLLHPERPSNRQLQLASEQDVAAYEAALIHRAHSSVGMPVLRLSADQMLQYQLRRQPFENPLKRSSANQAIAVIHAMYDFMRTPNAAMRQPYVVFNPARRVLKAGNRTPRKIDRILPLEAVQAMREYLLQTIKIAQATDELKAWRQAERKLWMHTLLFGLWSRREETVNLNMGDFTQADGRSWKVRLLRKGQQEQEIVVPNWVIEGLRRYRTSMGMPPQWAPGETTPALLDVRHEPGRLARPLSAHTLYMQMKELAKDTADEIRAGIMLQELEQPEREHIINTLERCSPHWFRHTGPTIAINNGKMSLTDASSFLGHKTTATTTMMYHHADDKQTRDGLEEMGRMIGAG